MKWSLLLILFFAKTLSAQVAASARDLSTLPPAVRPSIRYLSLANLPQAERASAAKVLSGHVNALSTEPDLVPLPLVQGSLLRINLEDYAWQKGTWEALADADPYFHVRTQVEQLWPGGVWRDGKEYAAGSFVSKTLVSALAPWLSETAADKEALAYLVAQTRSKAPIVRGDWFLYQTAQQTDRKPGYYDFLGIKDRAGLEKLVGFNAKVAADAKRKELLEAVAESRVAQQPRRIGAFNTVGGMRYWRTFDMKLAVDKKNPLRVLDNTLEHDAEEAFGPLANNFWAWGLFDADGKRQDSAPDFIGPDRTSSTNNGRIEVNLSCIRCHYAANMGGTNGLQSIDGWVRGLFVGDLKLQSPDYAVLKDLRQKYFRDLDGVIDDDRRTHARAVKEATGMTPAEWAKGYAALFARYEEPVTADRAAGEVGMLPLDFTRSLEAYLKRTGSLDPIPAALIRGKRVPIKQYEEAFPLIQLAVKGLVQP